MAGEAFPKAHGGCTPIDGRGMAPPPANPIRERLHDAKREAIESAMGKGESWCRKIINGETGITLDDLPALLRALDLKVVDINKVCLNAEVARAQETMLRAAIASRSLLFEDAE
jgi:hypothetical protein